MNGSPTKEIKPVEIKTRLKLTCHFRVDFNRDLVVHNAYTLSDLVESQTKILPIDHALKGIARSLAWTVVEILVADAQEFPIKLNRLGGLSNGQIKNGLKAIAFKLNGLELENCLREIALIEEIIFEQMGVSF